MIAFQEKSIGVSENLGVTLSRNTISLMLWMGFFFFFLAFAAIGQWTTDIIRDRRFKPEDIFLFVAVLLLAGYTFLGGAIFGFPKYQIPALPLICISAGIFLSRSPDHSIEAYLKPTVLIAFIAFGIQFLAAPDFLFTLRYAVREIAGFGSGDLAGIIIATMYRVAFLAFAFAVPVLSARHFGFRNRGLLLLLALAIGSNLAASFQQNRSGYYTGYNYGGSGTRETARFIRSKVPPLSRVIAPSEVIHYLLLPETSHVGNSLWTDRDQLAKILLDKNTSAIAYGIVTNSVRQVRFLSGNKRIQGILRLHFESRRIGSYILWVRKGYPERPDS